MRVLLASMLLAVTAACGGRQVNVETAPRAASSVTLRFTNNDTGPVNVYVVNNGQDTFLKNVAAKTTEDVAVPAVAVGTQVRLKATRTDGGKTYTSDLMSLDATTTWRVP